MLLANERFPLTVLMSNFALVTNVCVLHCSNKILKRTKKTFEFFFVRFSRGDAG